MNQRTVITRTTTASIPLSLGLAFVYLAALLSATAADTESRKIDFGPPGQSANAANDRAAHGIHLKSKTKGRADFESKAESCSVRKTILAGEEYTLLEVEGASLGGEAGIPQLPSFGQFVKVPAGAKVRLVIDKVDWVPIPGNFNIVPRQEAPWDSKDAPPRPFAKKLETYALDKEQPEATVRIAEEMRIREQSLVYVLYTPIVYNPARGQLRAARQVEWHLEFDGAEEKEAKADPLGSRAFAPLMQMALDAQPEGGSATPQEGPAFLATGSGADYLIITPNALYSSVLPLANWKHAKGYRTRVVQLSELASTTASGIAAYIKTAYDTWSPSPTFVLLVGDTNYIPAHYKTKHEAYYNVYTATDLYYSTVSGSDVFPDIFVGRLPCASVAECTNMVGKILTVEKTPSTLASMYQNAMMAGYFQDADSGDPVDGYEARLFLETSEGVKDFLTSRGFVVSTSYTTETSNTPRHYNRTDWYGGSILHTAGATYVGTQTYLTPTTARNAISSAVNSGIWLLQHRDHGYKTGWSDPPFDTTNVGSLVNSNKYPLVFSINCETAWFDNPTGNCMAEAWVKKDPGGSHCAIGASRISTSWWNDWFVHGMFECLYGNYLTSLAGMTGYKATLSYGDNYVGQGSHIGQMVNYGKVVMYDKIAGGSTAGTCLQQFEILTLLGDPEQSPRNSYPYNLYASYPAALVSTVATNFDVHVTMTGGSAQAGALVALVLDPNEYHTAITDASGNAHFSFTPHVPLPGNNQMSVVVSHQNRIPHQGTITIQTLGMVVTLPTSATEGVGVISGGGRVNIPAAQPSNVTVSLSSSDTTELTVPSSVTILAGSTSANFNLTVINDSLLDGPQNVQVTATAAAFGAAMDQMSVLDNEVANLAVSLPASATEGDSPLLGSVSISMTPQYAITVSLSSSDITELTVPPSVTINAFATSASFSAAVIDDNLIDGTRTATVTASAAGQNSGTDSVAVVDNETVNLTLQTPPETMEGYGTLINAGQVSIDGVLPTNLVVTLTSSDTTEVTVPTTATILAGNTSVLFSPTVINDVLTDGAQSALISANAPGMVGAANTMIVYDNELPPPAVNPSPADKAVDVIVTTALDWEYFGGSYSGVSNDVYFGRSPKGLVKLGTTTGTAWTLPRLAPNTGYYWQVATRRGTGTTFGPIWRFATRGVSYFTWSSIVSPQMAINPFGVILTARDEFHTVVSNFTQTVQLAALVGNAAQTNFSDSFEDGNYVGWTVGAGSYSRFVTNETSSAGSNSLCLVGGSGAHYDGLNVALPNLQPEFIRFSVRASNPNVYGSYVVLGTGPSVGQTAIWFYTRPDGTMGLYEDVQGPHTVPYAANRWYDITLQIDWANKRVDYYRDNILIESGIPFRNSSVANLTRLDVYNFENTKAWWDDFQLVSSNQLHEIAISPTVSGNFVEGIWSGSLAVLEPGTNAMLRARDAKGNQGYSGRFNVIPNTRPALSINDVEVVEGDTGTRSATFQVRLNPVATTNVTVHYQTVDGTALAGSDYLGTNGDLTFNAGVSSHYIYVPVYGDTVTEPDEQFTVQLSAPFNALLSNSVASCTILNDEIKPNVYLHSAVGEPWGSTSNQEAMNTVFGTNWFEATFEDISPALLFSSAVSFIFMDGSDHGAEEMEAFISGNLSRIYNWTYNGGFSLLNAAPNEGNGMYLGSSVNLVFPNLVRTGVVASATHPIVTGPFTPVGTSWYASYFAHGSISGSNLKPLIVSATNSATLLAAEKAYGAGNFVYAGLTTDNFHQPQPQAANLRANLLAWASNPRPYITISDGMVVEGNANETNLLNFTITLSHPYASNVTVSFGTAALTATAGVDYVVTNGSAVFLPGELNKQIPVKVRGDTVREGHETFRLSLTSAVNGVIEDSYGVGTILDDDLPPYVYVRSSAGEPWGSAAYTNGMDRVFGLNSWQSLFYETVDPLTLLSSVNKFIYLEGGNDSSTALENFLLSNSASLQSWVSSGGNLLINAAPNSGDGMYLGFNTWLVYPNQTRTSILVSVSHPIGSGPFTPVGTSWYGNSFGHASLSGSSITPLLVDITNSSKMVLAERGYGNGHAVFGGMTANSFHSPQPNASNLFANVLSWAADPKPYVSVDNAMIVEGNSGTTNANIIVRLSRPYSASVAVGFTTASGTALTGSDFIATNGILTFAAGETALPVPVRVVGDLIKEGHETFILRLQSAVNGVILDSDGVCTILDDDLSPYVYLRSSVAGEPWNRGDNTNCMHMAFGTNNWQSMYFESVNPATLFTPVTKCIFIEGSDDGALEMEAFLSANNSALYAWVYQGGSAFLNAAPREGDNIYLGNSVTLVYQGTNLTDTAKCALTNHPIFFGPYSPVGNTNWSGTSFAHATLSGSSLVSLITNAIDGTVVLAEKPYGLGTVLYGTMTMPSFHSPQPQATNLRANILAWTANSQPYVYVNDTTVQEGDAGIAEASFTVWLTRRDNSASSVNFGTSSGTATAGSDFVTTNGLVTFAAGTTSASFKVRVIGDTVGEYDETFNVALSNPTNCVLVDGRALGTILNDDIFMASVPFTETWEIGYARPFWNLSGGGPFQSLVVTSNTPHGGSYHMTLDSMTNGTFARNEVTLTLDLEGRTNVVLRFWAKQFNDEMHSAPIVPFQFGSDFDGLAISTDGVWWFPVMSLTNLTATYSEQVVNLDTITEDFGLSYTKPFFIRFNHYDNFLIPTDGMAIDDIGVTAELRVPMLAAGNTTLVAEGFAPPNNGIDPGEQVTVNFMIRNDGYGPTTNLVATLLTGRGVVLPSGSVTYGSIPALGGMISGTFTFSATGSCGGLILPTLQLQDGAANLGTLVFPIRLGAPGIPVMTLANATPVSIPSVGPATPSPSTITVAGYPVPPTRVWVSLLDLNHTYPDDIDILLVGPLGQKVMLMSDAGGSADLVHATLHFFDGAPMPLPDGTQIVSGYYAPTDYQPGEVVTNAPAGPYGTSLGVFSGVSANGTWQLFVQDDVGGDLGTIASGWELHLEGQAASCTPPSITLTATTQTNSFVLSFLSVPGRDHVVQYTDWLRDVTYWTNLVTLPGNGDIMTYVQPATNAHRFYRLVLP